MMTNIMIDLETLGNRSGAAIKSIGAVKFNREMITDEFYQVINLRTCIEYGLEMDPSTVEWWMRQDDDARELFETPGISIWHVLNLLAKWMGDEPFLLWGNGSDFDNVILANAYKKTEIKKPWEFYNNRCYRTMKNEYPEVELQRTGVHHNALDDATSQALHLIEIWKHTSKTAT